MQPPELGASGILQQDLFPVAVRATLMLAVFGNAIDLEATSVMDGVKIGVNAGAIVKAGFVAAAGIIGMAGWWYSAAVRKLFTTSIGILAVALLSLYVLAIPGSVYPAVSIVATIALTSYILFIATALIFVGPPRVLYDVIIAMTLYLCVAWLACLIAPSYGFLHERAGNQGEISRMTGLAHPNTLGAISGLFIILLLAAFRENVKNRGALSAGAALGLLTLVGSLSRTAMVACLVSVIGFHRKWLWHRHVVFAAVPTIFLCVLAVLFIDNQYGLDRIAKKVLINVSKTKDAEEITSATGRTAIWAEAWTLIRARPIIGYGANTSPILLKNHSFQTHNILLNPMLCFGLGGGLVIGTWLCLNIYWSFRSDNQFVAAIGIFIVVSGLTEDTILSTFPEPTTLVWLIASFIPYVDVAKRRAISSKAPNTILATSC
jgi:exopolysaccharide production protein ExoQ